MQLRKVPCLGLACSSLLSLLVVGSGGCTVDLDGAGRAFADRRLSCASDDDCEDGASCVEQVCSPDDASGTGGASAGGPRTGTTTSTSATTTTTGASATTTTTTGGASPIACTVDTDCAAGEECEHGACAPDVDETDDEDETETETETEAEAEDEDEAGTEETEAEDDAEPEDDEVDG